MNSNNLNNNIDLNYEFKGKIPFKFSELGLFLINPDEKTIKTKERLIDLINNESFIGSEFAIFIDDYLYFALIALSRGADKVYCLTNSGNVDSYYEFIENTGLNIELIDKKEKIESAIYFTNEADLIDNESIYILETEDNLEINYPTNEIKTEFQESKLNLNLLDIFILLKEKKLEYFILKNWQLLIYGVDEYEDLSIEVYMSEESKNYFDLKFGKKELVNIDDRLFYLIDISEDQDRSQFLKLNIIKKEDNLIDNELINYLSDKIVNDFGINVLDDKFDIFYLIYYGFNLIGAFDEVLFENIKLKIENNYNALYEYRINSVYDLIYFFEKELNTKLEFIKISFHLPNYILSFDSLIHNYKLNNEIFRVYFANDSEYRQVSPNLAAKDIFILEKSGVETEIIEENEKFICYKVISGKHQILINPFNYLNNLMEDDWKELEISNSSDFILAPRVSVIVLTMHRSGSSMLTSILEELGLKIGTKILGKNDSNPEGHFEDQDFIELNDQILKSFGADWSKPPELGHNFKISEQLDSEINSFLENKNKSIFWGWKDPRTSITIQYFYKHLKKCKFIYLERDKDEVVKSLMKRNAFNEAKSQEIYDNYINNIESFLFNDLELESLRINHGDIIHDPEMNILKLIEFLEIEVNESFIDNAKKRIKVPIKFKNGKFEILTLLNQVNEAISNTNFSEALSFINHLISKYEISQIPNIEFLRAYCLNKLGRNAEAYKAAKNEIIINPLNDNAHNLLSKILENNPEYDEPIIISKTLTIAIPVFNNSRFTDICLNALFENTTGIDFEVIVVDNGSSDNTNEILAKYISYPNFKIISNSENLGFAKANNQALAIRNGKHFMMLNNDCVVTKNCFVPLIEEVEKGAGIAGAMLLYPNTEIVQHIFVSIGTEDGKTLAPYHPLQFHSLPETFETQRLNVTAVTGAAMMISESLADKIELDDEYQNGLEDIDLCLMAKKLGYNVVSCLDSVIYHFESVSQDRHKYDLKNWQRFNQKWLGKINFDETQNETGSNVKDIKEKYELNKESIKNASEEYLNNYFDIKNQLLNPAEKIDFSIIIPVHNNLEFTRNCINNIYKTSALYSIEVIVIDNASNDGTKEYLKSIKNQVILIRNEENRNYAKANNQGAEIARGQYLIFLNNDVDVMPGWFEALEMQFNMDAKIGIQGGKLLYPNGLIQHAGIVWGQVAQNLSLHFHIYLSASADAPGVNKLREFQMVTGAMLSIRNSLFKRIGGFDEKYNFGHEDLDLCLAARSIGYKVIYNPEAVGIHHESVTKKSEGIEKFERFFKNPESFDALNHNLFLSKWKSFLLTDAPRYYLEDRMFGLLGDLVKFEDFEQGLKQLFDLLKDIPNEKYQKFASEVSQILFGKPNVDFVGNPTILLNVSMDVIEKSIEFLSKKTASSKKRILMTMFGWNESGGGTILPKTVAYALSELDYDVMVFYTGVEHPDAKTPYFVDKSIDKKVKLIGVFNRGKNFINPTNPKLEIADPNILEIFEKVLIEFEPDVIHFHNFLGLSFKIAEIAYNYGIYSIYTPHNYHVIDPGLYMMGQNLKKWDGPDFLINSSYAKDFPELTNDFIERKRTTQKLLKEWINLVANVSERQKNIMLEFAGESNRFVTINQIPYSTEPLLKSTDLLRIQENKKIHKPIRFGYIGAIIPQKGIHNLLSAASALPEDSCEILLYGFVSNDYFGILNKMDIKVNVKFMGEYSDTDLPGIESEIDVAILPSIWEDCAPLVITECLAMKIPVIAPNIGGFGDFIKDGFNGFIYDYNNVGKLAEILFKIINNPDIINDLIENCFLPFTFDDYVKHLAKIYSEKPTNDKISEYQLSFKDKLKDGKGINQFMDVVPEIETDILPINRIKFEKNFPGGFSNNRAMGVLPNLLPTPLKLNLGCGNDFRPGFINIDLFNENPNVVYMDIRSLNFLDESVDLILASDILEHFSHREVDSILKEWSRVLKPDGMLIIRCPNIRLQINAYNRGDWDADVASYMIFGGQTNPGDYHCIGFDEKSITKRLEKAGFKVNSIDNEDFPQDKGFINLNMTVKSTKIATDEFDIEEFNSVKNIFKENQKEFSSDKTKEPNILKIYQETEIELNVVWEGSQLINHSLALINREICHKLLESNVINLTIIPFEPDEFEAGNNPKYQLLKQNDINEKQEVSQNILDLPYIWIRHQWPPKDEPPIGAKWIIMQPWEYTTIKKDMIPAFEECFEIWTPSNYSREAFIRSGIDSDKIQVMPNGIDPKLFTPEGNKYKLKTKKRFKFLFVGGTLPRKGIDILLASYISAFRRTDDVCLVVKDLGTQTFYRGQTAVDTIKEYVNNTDYPEIEYIDSSIDESLMADLYRACDVYVSPYRGEGFSLPTLEAMACGLPVVVTDGGSTDDFVDSTCGWKIPSEYRPIGNKIAGMDVVGEAGWLLPDSKVLSLILFDLYQNPSKVFHTGIRASAKARKEWTWRRSAMKILSRIDAIYGTQTAKKANERLEIFSDFYLELGEAENQFNLGKLDIAFEIYLKLLEEAPNQKLKQYILNAILLIKLQVNNLEEIELYFRESESINKENTDLIYLKAMYLDAIGDFSSASELLSPVLNKWEVKKWDSKIGLTIDLLIVFLADCSFKLKDFDGALQMYEIAVKYNPMNIEALFGISYCFMSSEEFDKSRIFLERIIEIDPENDLAKEEIDNLSAIV